MSTTVYSQVLIYTAELTGASIERKKMPNHRNGSKAGIRTRAHLIASPAFYRWATVLHERRGSPSLRTSCVGTTRFIFAAGVPGRGKNWLMKRLGNRYSSTSSLVSSKSWEGGRVEIGFEIQIILIITGVQYIYIYIYIFTNIVQYCIS